MGDKLKVTAYCRVSTEKDDQINSLQSQKNYFNNYINDHDDWELVNIYADEGISGTSTKNRAQFNQMTADAKNNKIDLILTKEVSRFARNTVDTLHWTRELKSIGIGVLFINDNINTLDSEGEFRLTIMASAAQEESRKTSERVKWGQKRRMEQGVVFGRDMLGYYVRAGNLIINPDEADIVKLIYHKYLDEEKGTHIIAKELYESGINAKRVKHWNNNVILRVLRNEKYAGDLCQKKTYTPDYLTHSKKYNKNNEEMIYIKDHHEPIIDRSTWDRVQQELKRRSQSDEQKSKHSNRYWCSGRISCGECGARFVSRTKKLGSGSGTYKAWRCYNSATHGTKKQDINGDWIGCGSYSVNEKVIYFCVGYVIKYVLKNKNAIIKELIEDIKLIKKTAVVIDTGKFKKKVEKINKDKEKLIKMRIENEINKNDFIMMNKSYDDEINLLTNKIEEAEKINYITGNQVENLNIYIKEIKNMLDFDENADRDVLYREILDKIVIYNDNILDIYLKSLPFGIGVKYSTIGRSANYTINIEDIMITENK
ncbi:MAG: recombinase family protein [Oscillospiraceae bacterium]|nr:recombinase family protein [Oscillospiraceae bacterium]